MVWLYIEKTVSFDEILDDTSEFGFNATSDAPMCFWYEQQMERYPNAKVVLTVRGDGSGDAWAKSFSSAILDIMVVLKEIPYRWFSMFRKIEGVVQTMFHALGTDIDPETQYPVVDQLSGAYTRWVESVKVTVPKEKLLVHAPQDGWKPLCKFLSPLSNEIASNCDSILASGEPYPHVNDKAKVQSLLVGLRTLSMLCKLSPLILAFVIVLMLVPIKNPQLAFLQTNFIAAIWCFLFVATNPSPCGCIEPSLL